MHLHFPRIWVSQIFFFFFRSFVLKPVKEAEQRSLIFQEQNMLFKKAKNRAKIVNVLVFEHLFFEFSSWERRIQQERKERKKNKLIQCYESKLFYEHYKRENSSFFQSQLFFELIQTVSSSIITYLTWHGAWLATFQQF